MEGKWQVVKLGQPGSIQGAKEGASSRGFLGAQGELGEEERRLRCLVSFEAVQNRALIYEQIQGMGVCWSRGSPTIAASHV
jgi:hypothetical protein